MKRPFLRDCRDESHPTTISLANKKLSDYTNPIGWGRNSIFKEWMV